MTIIFILLFFGLLVPFFAIFSSCSLENLRQCDTVERCLIEAMSWSNVDSLRYGYIDINGNRVISTTSPDYRGFNLVELNVSSCWPSKILHYDTWASTNDSENMATYIKGLPLYTVLIGVTADEATYSLTQNARLALVTIGVNINQLTSYSKLFFVAQIGRPGITVSKMAVPGGNSLNLTVAVTATDYGDMSMITFTQM